MVAHAVVMRIAYHPIVQKHSTTAAGPCQDLEKKKNPRSRTYESTYIIPAFAERKAVMT